jgi:hypothetical protein
MAFAESASTPILTGEMTVSVSVQGAFVILGSNPLDPTRGPTRDPTRLLSSADVDGVGESSSTLSFMAPPQNTFDLSF